MNNMTTSILPLYSFSYLQERANSSAANETINGTPFTYSGTVNFINQVMRFSKEYDEEMNDIVSAEREKMRKRQDDDHGDTKRTCLVCREKPRKFSFVHNESAHFCACTSCAFRIAIKNSQCPICNIPATSILRTYE